MKQNAVVCVIYSQNDRSVKCAGRETNSKTNRKRSAACLAGDLYGGDTSRPVGFGKRFKPNRGEKKIRRIRRESTRFEYYCFVKLDTFVSKEQRLGNSSNTTRGRPPVVPFCRPDVKRRRTKNGAFENHCVHKIIR